MDKKRRIYLFVILFIIFVMLWAFVSAGLITSNFNRAQVKGSANDQKVNAFGLIITETKQGKKYFEIYGESGNYSNDHSELLLQIVDICEAVFGGIYPLKAVRAHVRAFYVDISWLCYKKLFAALALHRHKVH